MNNEFESREKVNLRQAGLILSRRNILAIITSTGMAVGSLSTVPSRATASSPSDKREDTPSDGGDSIEIENDVYKIDVGETESGFWIWPVEIDGQRTTTLYQELFALQSGNGDVILSYNPTEIVEPFPDNGQPGEKYSCIIKYEVGGTELLVKRTVRMSESEPTFTLKYDIRNIGSGTIDELNFYEHADFDNGRNDFSDDVGFYQTSPEYIYTTDDSEYGGFSGNQPSVNHHIGEFPAIDELQNADLNNRDKYPESGSSDPVCILQWELGTLAPDDTTSITLQYGGAFSKDTLEQNVGEPEEIETEPPSTDIEIPIAKIKPVQSVFKTGLSDNFDLVADKRTAVLVYFKETDALEDLTESAEISIGGPVVESDSKVVDASTIKDNAAPSEEDRDDSEDFVPIRTRAIETAETGDIEITVTPNQNGFSESTATQAAKVWETDGISLEHYNLRVARKFRDDINFLPTDRFNSHVDESDGFLQGTFPVPEPSFASNRTRAVVNIADFTDADIPFTPGKAAAANILNNLEHKRQQSDNNPDFGIGVADEELFEYLGLSNVVGFTKEKTNKQTAIAKVDYYVATAHEIGHQFDLYANQEEYDNVVLDEVKNDGYWVSRSEYVTSTEFDTVKSFMSGAIRGVTSRNFWMENEPCDWEADGKLIGDGQLFLPPQKDQADFDVIFNELLTSADASSDSTSSSQRASSSDVNVTQATNDTNTESVVYIKGLISESDEFFPQRWYYYDDLDPTETNEGDYAIVIKDDDGSIVVEKPFTASFRLLTTNQGIIPQDVAGISFAAKYPETARAVEVTRDETTLATFDPTVKLLRDGINSIPADGFKSPGKSDVAEQRRNALLNKVDAIENQLDAGNIRGAVQKLQNDLRPKIKRWIKDEYEVNEPFQITRAELIDIVNDQISRLKNIM